MKLINIVGAMGCIIMLLGACGQENGTSSTTQKSSGWQLTVYYTAVDSFHSGSPSEVTGCFDSECNSSGNLGTYPQDFVKAVKDEGSGRITGGRNAGKYLNWSSDIGYWLDTDPRDAQGGRLIPYVSSAADSNVLDFGTFFTILDCGKSDPDGELIDTSFCNQLKGATWTLTDRFTPGLGGAQHIDLYIGEEDQINFVSSSPKIVSTTGATISLRSK